MSLCRDQDARSLPDCSPSHRHVKPVIHSFGRACPGHQDKILCFGKLHVRKVLDEGDRPHGSVAAGVSEPLQSGQGGRLKENVYRRHVADYAGCTKYAQAWCRMHIECDPEGADDADMSSQITPLVWPSRVIPRPVTRSICSRGSHHAWRASAVLARTGQDGLPCCGSQRWKVKSRSRPSTTDWATRHSQAPEESPLT